jgi:hypothetical protein
MQLEGQLLAAQQIEKTLQASAAHTGARCTPQRVGVARPLHRATRNKGRHKCRAAGIEKNGKFKKDIAGRICASRKDSEKISDSRQRKL